MHLLFDRLSHSPPGQALAYRENLQARSFPFFKIYDNLHFVLDICQNARRPTDQHYINLYRTTLRLRAETASEKVRVHSRAYGQPFLLIARLLRRRRRDRSTVGIVMRSSAALL